MHTIKRAVPVVLVLVGILSHGDVWARQNIAIGEISVGYDYQKYNYDRNDVNELAGTSFILLDGSEQDTRNLFVTPRIRLSSRGISDLLEFTYAPSFTYDDIDNSSYVGQNLNVNAEKNLTRDWQVRATNSYFYGQDPVSDYQQRTSAIMPTETGAPTAPSVGAGQPTNLPQQLTNDYGSQLYWRNDLGLRTDYTYAQDSVVGIGYNFGVLRNVDNNVNDYTDYDRHEGVGRLSYRFNQQWSAETELSYVKGTYDQAPVEVIQPAPSDNTIAITTVDSLNDNLQEYHARGRANYGWRPHDIFFGQYSYVKTNYESEFRQDAAIHEMTLGWDHDFSNHLHMTLSGGPTFVTFEGSSDETGYNAFAGLIWNHMHSTLTANTSYRYDFDNFDGSNSGLSKIWLTTLGYQYRFSPVLQAALNASYEKADQDNPGSTGVVILTGGSESAINTLAGDAGQFQYQDETSSLGMTVSYTFLQFYTLAATYTYTDFQSDYQRDYDEHSAMLQLSASTELFRW